MNSKCRVFMHKHRSQIKKYIYRGKGNEEEEKRASGIAMEQQALPNRLSSHKIDCLNDLKSKQ